MLGWNNVGLLDLVKERIKFLEMIIIFKYRRIIDVKLRKENFLINWMVYFGYCLKVKEN